MQFLQIMESCQVEGHKYILVTTVSFNRLVFHFCRKQVEVIIAVDSYR